MGSYENNYLYTTRVLSRKPNTNKPGYICDCERGSPEPGRVILVSKLHSRDCHVRRKLAGGDYTIGGEGFLL